MARVAVIGADESDGELLRRGLSRAGHDVQLLAGARNVEAFEDRWHPDVVVLDSESQDDVTDRLASLRREPATCRARIVMLVGGESEVDAYAPGALVDAYVVKPFGVEAFVARLSTVLRSSNVVDRDSRVLEIGQLRIDREAGLVFVNGRAVELTRLEYKLLLTLYARRPHPQTRRELLGEVWGIHADIASRTTDTHVKRLREKLGPAGAYIVTLRARGYSFVESAEEPTEGPFVAGTSRRPDSR